MTEDDLTRFQYDILLVIAAADQHGGIHGLGVKDALEAEYGIEVNHGRLYPNLDTLADRGLLSKRARDGRSNTYTLTDAGIGVLEDRYQFVRSSVSASFVIEHGGDGIGFRGR